MSLEYLQREFMKPTPLAKDHSSTKLRLHEPTFAYPVRLYHQAWLEHRITTAELAILCNPEVLLGIVRAYEATLKEQRPAPPPTPDSENTLWKPVFWSFAAVGLTTAGLVIALFSFVALEESYAPPYAETVVSYQIFGYPLARAVQNEIAEFYVPEWSTLDPTEHLTMFREGDGVRLIVRTPEIDVFGLRQVFVSRGYTVSQVTGNSLLITSKTVYD